LQCTQDEKARLLLEVFVGMKELAIGDSDLVANGTNLLVCIAYPTSSVVHGLTCALWPAGVEATVSLVFPSPPAPPHENNAPVPLGILLDFTVRGNATDDDPLGFEIVCFDRTEVEMRGMWRCWWFWRMCWTMICGASGWWIWRR
jgi:hypothetical protein